GPDPVYDTIVWDLRAPRVLMAVIVGAGLALAGAGMQTLVRNPLADPYLLGISSGAGVGATLVIVLGVLGGLGIWALSLGALSGALLAALLVFGVSMAQGGLTPLRLILTGVVMSAAFSSVSSFLVFLSDDPQATQSVLFWLLGSLSGTVWSQILPSLLVVADPPVAAGGPWLRRAPVGSAVMGGCAGARPCCFRRARGSVASGADRTVRAHLDPGRRAGGRVRRDRFRRPDHPAPVVDPGG